MIYYFIFINGVAYLSMLIDKHKAIKHQWRISEKTLFFMAFIGGAWGLLAGMFCFHHKTKHISFLIGIPLLCLLQLLICFYLNYQSHIFF